LATDSLKSAKTAPFVEKLVQKDIEVSVWLQIVLVNKMLSNYVLHAGTVSCRTY